MLKLFKAKSLKKTRETENISLNERTQEKEKSKGRSMVEMLGVLAIIGVLSIGGIQGYTMAMRRYRANEILNIVQKYATVIYSGCQQAIEKDPEEYSNDGFWYCPAIDFTDSGLGSLPTGVLSIGYMPGDKIEVNPWGSCGAHCPGGVSIRSFSSGDAVVIKVKFETQELCETVKAITGAPLTDNEGTIGMTSMYGYGLDATCGNNNAKFNIDDGYYLTITTMMN